MELDKFQRLGLLNKDAPDLSELETKPSSKAIMEARCTSHQCWGRSNTGNKGRIKMNIEYPEQTCPDCGWALFWQKEKVEN